MFHLVAAALLGGFLAIGLAWGPLGIGALALAPFVASLSALAVAVAFARRASRAAAAAAWIRDLRAGLLVPGTDDRRTDPAALCRRRA